MSVVYWENIQNSTKSLESLSYQKNVRRKWQQKKVHRAESQGNRAQDANSLSRESQNTYSPAAMCDSLHNTLPVRKGPPEPWCLGFLLEAGHGAWLTVHVADLS